MQAETHVARTHSNCSPFVWRWTLVSLCRPSYRRTLEESQTAQSWTLTMNHYKTRIQHAVTLWFLFSESSELMRSEVVSKDEPSVHKGDKHEEKLGICSSELVVCCYLVQLFGCGWLCLLKFVFCAFFECTRACSMFCAIVCVWWLYLCLHIKSVLQDECLSAYCLRCLLPLLPDTVPSVGKGNSRMNSPDIVLSSNTSFTSRNQQTTNWFLRKWCVKNVNCIPV